MKFIHVPAVLVVLGALNWGLVGLFHFDVVLAVLGDATVLSRFAYLAVGAAGLFQILQWTVREPRAVGARATRPGRFA